MLLKDFLQQLAMGPVGELSVGGDNSGAIPVIQVPRMINHLNTALTDLHTRFCLRKESLQLASLVSRSTYPLQAKHALTSGSMEPDKFIIDTALKPFTGGLLGIEEVLDADQCRLPLNVQGDVYGWHTSRFDTLNLGYPTTGDVYFVQYRARHPVIAANADPETIEIQVPPSLETALVTKTGQLVYGAMTTEAAILKANELAQAYEQLCGMTESTNLTNTSEVDQRAERFVRDGWI